MQHVTLEADKTSSVTLLRAGKGGAAGRGRVPASWKFCSVRAHIVDASLDFYPELLVHKDWTGNNARAAFFFSLFRHFLS